MAIRDERQIKASLRKMPEDIREKYVGTLCDILDTHDPKKDYKELDTAFDICCAAWIIAKVGGLTPNQREQIEGHLNVISAEI